MGTRLQRRPLQAPMFPVLADGPFLEPLGGGPYELMPGQPDWELEMAQVGSQVLREQGRYDLGLTARAYLRWAEKVSPPERLPVPIRTALEYVREGRPPELTGRRVWLESFQRLKTNEALIRSVPYALYFYAHRNDRLLALLEDTSLTHFDPLCQLAATLVGGLLAHAVSAVEERIEPAKLLPIAETELAAAASLVAQRDPEWVLQIQEAADALREDLRRGNSADPELYGPELHLFQPVPTPVRVTLRLAFWELFHAPSPEAGIIDAVNRGGDAQTNGAITGALLGAVHGERALPQSWVDVVLESRGGANHPRNLVTLAGNVPGAPVAPPDPWA